MKRTSWRPVPRMIDDKAERQTPGRDKLPIVSETDVEHRILSIEKLDVLPANPGVGIPSVRCNPFVSFSCSLSNKDDAICRTICSPLVSLTWVTNDPSVKDLLIYMYMESYRASDWCVNGISTSYVCLSLISRVWHTNWKLYFCFSN